MGNVKVDIAIKYNPTEFDSPSARLFLENQISEAVNNIGPDALDSPSEIASSSAKNRYPFSVWGKRVVGVDPSGRGGYALQGGWLKIARDYNFAPMSDVFPGSGIAFPSNAQMLTEASFEFAQSSTSSHPVVFGISFPSPATTGEKAAIVFHYINDLPLQDGTLPDYQTQVPNLSHGASGMARFLISRRCLMPAPSNFVDKIARSLSERSLEISAEIEIAITWPVDSVKMSLAFFGSEAMDADAKRVPQYHNADAFEGAKQYLEKSGVLLIAPTAVTFTTASTLPTAVLSYQDKYGLGLHIAPPKVLVENPLEDAGEGYCELLTAPLGVGFTFYAMSDGLVIASHQKSKSSLPVNSIAVVALLDRLSSVKNLTRSAGKHAGETRRSRNDAIQWSNDLIAFCEEQLQLLEQYAPQTKLAIRQLKRLQEQGVSLSQEK